MVVVVVGVVGVVAVAAWSGATVVVTSAANPNPHT